MLLSPRIRILLLLTHVFLGLFPAVALLFWIERHCSLPRLSAEEPGLPWADLAGGSLVSAVLINLLLGTGLALARAGLDRLPGRAFPFQARPTLRLAAWGTLAVAVIGLWQPTGVVLWAFPARPDLVQGLSFALFWALIAAAAWLELRHDPAGRLGLSQIYSTGRPRHSAPVTPTCSAARWLVVLAIGASPFFMTLDRVLVLSAATFGVFIPRAPGLHSESAA